MCNKWNIILIFKDLSEVHQETIIPATVIGKTSFKSKFCQTVLLNLAFKHSPQPVYQPGKPTLHYWDERWWMMELIKLWVGVEKWQLPNFLNE